MAAKKRPTGGNKGRLPTVAEKRRVIEALRRVVEGHKQLTQHVERAKKQLQDLDYIDI